MPSGRSGVSATNPLREIVHTEVVPLGFEVKGSDLRPLDLGQAIDLSRHDGRPLSEAGLAAIAPELQGLWLDHRDHVENALVTFREARKATIESALAATLKVETSREREKFASRKKELQAQRLPKAVEKLRKEAEETERRLALSPMLFREMQEAEERRLRELQWEVHRTQQDQLLAYLEREETRVLTQVLPRRFALVRLDVQPVAVEYWIGT